jgi:MFS superfamily sulfate permease-like transporter
MTPKQHITFFIQGIVAWALFWLAGLPDYYQQYSPNALGMGGVLLQLAISFLAVYVLRRGRPERRMPRALWISFYFTVPLAVLDTLYCGVYLGHGWSYLWTYWYLTIYYISPWLTFPPIAWLLSKDGAAARTG